MIESIVEFLQNLPPRWIVFWIATLPISELRGAIPIGHTLLEMPIRSAYLWAVLGNLLPVIPLLLFLDGVSKWLSHHSTFFEKFFTWLFYSTEAKTRFVRRLEAVGLTLFVMIPLPITGAWTGCAAAYIFRFPFRIALPAIACGVIFSGLIVSFAVHTGLQLFYAPAP